jgi:hypothetical protein
MAALRAARPGLDQFIADIRKRSEVPTARTWLGSPKLPELLKPPR